MNSMNKKQLLLGIAVLTGLGLYPAPMAGAAAAAVPVGVVQAEAAAPVITDFEQQKDGVRLGWQAVPGAESYAVYRADSRWGSYQKVGVTSAQQFEDKSPQAKESYYKLQAIGENLPETFSQPMSQEIKLWGPNVYVFSAKDSAEQVQKTTDALFAQQEAAQFKNGRYAMFFKPGTYDAEVKVGFYTQAAGLGQTPDDTAIRKLFVDAKWLPDNATNPNNATCNFWRSAENLAVQQDSQWAVSQAAPLRRMHFEQGLRVHAGGWASGGYLADSKVDGLLDYGGQQQWFTRNTELNGKISGGAWNIVYAGVKNAPAESADWKQNVNTVLPEIPVVAERPYLYLDPATQDYRVFVPAVRHQALGVSWQPGQPGEGKSLGLDRFYIASPSRDTAQTINAALQAGKNLIFQPGIYHLQESIRILRPDTVVLGLGFATLMPENGVIGLDVADVSGVRIAGLLLDAGEGPSPALVRVGTEKTSRRHADNPVILSDIVCRIGGDRLGRAVVGMEINSNDVVGDHFWIWRADHGKEVAWNKNTAKNGLVVAGDHVTTYGLMVEHFQEYQTLWKGDAGRAYFYQSEIPYEVPEQSVWMSHEGKVNGYASFKVEDSVKSFAGYGFGIYCFFNQGKDILLNSAMEMPQKQGVYAHHVLDLWLPGKGGITHVINDVGDSAYDKVIRNIVLDYPVEK